MKQFKKLYEEDMYCGDEELDQILDELTEFRVIGKAQRRKIAILEPWSAWRQWRLLREAFMGSPETN